LAPVKCKTVDDKVELWLKLGQIGCPVFEALSRIMYSLSQGKFTLVWFNVMLARWSWFAEEWLI